MAIIYEHYAGSVAYFAPGAPAFAEAGVLKSDDFATTRRVLDERGCLAEMQCYFQLVALPGACGVSISATKGTGIPSSKIQALYGDCAATYFSVSA